MDTFASAVGSFMAEVELTSDAIDCNESIGWVVVCIDMEKPVTIVYTTGVFNSPEEALVEAGKQAAESKKHHDDDSPGWEHVVVPLYPPSESV